MNDMSPVSAVTLTEWARQTPAFEQVAAWTFASYSLGGEREPERVPGMQVSRGLLEITGISPALGRGFSSDEYASGRDRVVLLGHGFWTRRYGGDPKVVGGSLKLNGEWYTVVGVLGSEPSPAGVGLAAELVTPLFIDTSESRTNRHLLGLARLKPGATTAEARTQLAAVSARLEREYPDTNKGWTAAAIGMRELDFNGDGRMFLFLMVGAELLLAVVCANVTNLLLASGSERHREIAIRTAIGASRTRVARQLLTETLVLAAGGCGLGILVAYAARNAIRAFVSGTNIGHMDLEVDARVLVFAVGVSLLSGLAVGLVPALRTSTANLSETLKDGGKSTACGRARLRSVLVIAEVALSLVLLTAASMMVRVSVTISRNDPGFRIDRLVKMELAAPAKGNRTLDELLVRLEGMPGLEAAGLTTMTPLCGGVVPPSPFTVEGRSRPAPGQAPTTGVVVVSADYFKTLKVPLKAGRGFNRQDVAGSMPVALINDVMARKFWPGENPVGARVEVNGISRTIVGVVAGFRTFHLVMPPTPELFIPYSQAPASGFALLVRTRTSDPLSFVSVLKKEIHALDPDLPVTGVSSMEQLLDWSMGGWRFMGGMVGSLAVIALGLAAIGLYGLLAYFVSGRTREIGIRMALGATPAQVNRLVLKQGFHLVAWGAVPGLALAFAVAQMMSMGLTNIFSVDVWSLAGAPLVLGCVALAACYLPARRATRIEPMQELHAE